MRIRKKYQVIPTNAKLENGDSTSATNGYTAEYINNHSVVVSPTEPSESARKKVWKQFSGNIFDGELEVGGIAIATGQNIVTDARKRSKNYIAIEPNLQYTIKLNTNERIVVFEYNENKGFISATSDDFIPQPYIFTTTQNTKYIRFSIYSTNATQATIELINKEYILNNNNVYEEYVPQNEIYSESEIKIGTYLGKPLYRKVVEINGTSLTPGSGVNVNHNISNLDTIIDIKAISIRNDGAKFVLPVVGNGTNIPNWGQSIGDLTTTSINVFIGSSYTDTRAISKMYVTAEYTKTTD